MIVGAATGKRRLELEDNYDAGRVALSFTIRVDVIEKGVSVFLFCHSVTSTWSTSIGPKHDQGDAEQTIRCGISSGTVVWFPHASAIGTYMIYLGRKLP